MKKFALLTLGLTAILLAESKSKLTVYDFNLPNIEGKMISFSQYKGKVMLIVNVASESSYAPQYGGLEALYDKYKQAGLVVFGFPSNDFGNEEPLPEAKIKAFSETSYHVTFPLFSKISVRGDDITPLFHFLTKEANPKIKGDVHWNFTKFIVDRKGNLVCRFEPGVAPDDPDVIMAIESALDAKQDGKAGEKEVNPQTPPSPARGDSPERPTRSDE